MKKLKGKGKELGEASILLFMEGMKLTKGVEKVIKLPLRNMFVQLSMYKDIELIIKTQFFIL